MSLSIVDEFNLIQFNSIQFNSIHSLTQLSYYNNSIDRIVSQYELIVFSVTAGFSRSRTADSQSIRQMLQCDTICKYLTCAKNQLN